jgi:predicted transcriptional regulator
MVGRYVTNEVRNRIVGMKLAGLSEIAIIVDRSKSTISRIIKSYHEHGFVELQRGLEDYENLKTVIG